MNARTLPQSTSLSIPRVARSLLGIAALLSVCGACGNRDSSASVDPKLVDPKLADPKPAVPAASAPATAPKKHVPVYMEAVGPELVVAPGKGISAIRFGTNLENLQRHMDAPCEVQTETRCLYVERAVDFSLKDGGVVGMKAYRKDRHVPGLPERVFGIFKGYMLPSIQFGLHRHIVAEEIKMKPERVEPVLNGAEGLVFREYYPGVTIEYDRLTNGNIVAASFEVTLPSSAPASSPAVAPGPARAPGSKP